MNSKNIKKILNWMITNKKCLLTRSQTVDEIRVANF